ncbi:cytosine permease [Kibdelosporangium philippinense]|uniref:Cytosine permease n=1 Tax=Kibdelosporangium philippinense TaxID=211113 RepID=A0ABS8ZW55_9PSEU|nr:hydantoinase/oxoprolinase family protein [Kibdelosporangium philippinense]MCE7011933.1 cytosine permease [Kibdelosporangium philippinense]
MALDHAKHLPVLTIGSGPANSIRGGAFLTGVKDALVVDVGGTSTDIGVLTNGFPRESALGVRIGGIATNFRMPDLVSIAIGGGSTVRLGDDGRVHVGPDSVGYRLPQEALIFGGQQATLSDAAVARGRARFGSHPVNATDALAQALAHADHVIAEVLLTRWTGFGRYGSTLIGLVITVSLFGWFGIQTAVFAEGLHSMVPAIPLWAWCLITGLGVTMLVLREFPAMGWTAFITVPAFLGLAGWAMTVQISQHSFADLTASPPFGTEMSIATGATIVAGSYIIGAVVTPDMTRFNRSTGDVVKQTLIGVSLGEYVLGLAGVLLAYAVKTSDVIAIITASSGVAGVIILVPATVKINNWNLYSCALGTLSAVESLFRVRLNRVRVTIVTGVLGSIAAAAGILGAFTDFLTLLGVLTPPIAGIMVAEYFIVKRWRPQLDASRALGRLPDTEPTWVPATILIWLAASTIGWLSEHFRWWGIPAVNSLLLGGIGYVIAGALGLIRGRGETTFEQPEHPAAALEPS